MCLTYILFVFLMVELAAGQCTVTGISWHDHAYQRESTRYNRELRLRNVVVRPDERESNNSRRSRFIGRRLSTLAGEA